jgi:NADPH:quinone reductase-like Zn-dependent oxidoreductase
MRVEERPDPVPGDHELLVAARFAGINAADLAQRAGSYPAPPGAPQDVPGLEVAGTVVAVGAGVLSSAAGDRVFGLVGGGGLADRVVVHERHVARVPDELTDEEAAAVPEAFITAHDAIVTRGGLGLGDVLLVTGANGGVGTSAGAQADVALGRLMGKRAAIHGTVLRARSLEEKAAAVQRFAHEVVPHLASGRMRAVIDRVFPADEAADAFDHMSGSGKLGKVLLAF